MDPFFSYTALLFFLLIFCKRFSSLPVFLVLLFFLCLMSVLFMLHLSVLAQFATSRLGVCGLGIRVMRPREDIRSTRGAGRQLKDGWDALPSSCPSRSASCQDSVSTRPLGTCVFVCAVPYFFTLSLQCYCPRCLCFLRVCYTSLDLSVHVLIFVFVVKVPSARSHSHSSSCSCSLCPRVTVCICRCGALSLRCSISVLVARCN